MICVQHGTKGAHCGPECDRLTRIYQHARRRATFRLVRGGKTLTWQRPGPDSRVEEVACDAEWFYAQMLGGGHA